MSKKKKLKGFWNGKIGFFGSTASSSQARDHRDSKGDHISEAKTDNAWKNIKL